MNNKNVISDLITVSKKLNKFVIGAEGNISGKINDCFYIKASGCSLNNLTENDLIKCDLNGKQINNLQKKPSIETHFHSFLLQKSNINFVIHTHPTSTLKILCSNLKNINEFAKKRLFPDQVVFNGEISCIVPYAHPGLELLEKIKLNVDNHIRKNQIFPKLILLINHGIICSGASVNECLINTEICEKAAEIYLANLNKSKFLSNKDIKRISNDENEKYRLKLKQNENIN